MPDEIIIKIKRRRRRKNRTIQPVATVPGGILTPRGESDYQARRLNNDVLVNFYDFGQIRQEDASFADLAFSVYNGGASGDEPNPLTLSDLESLENKIFDIPVEDWETNYRKLTYEEAYRYGLAVYYEQPITTLYDTSLDTRNEKWKTGGLKAKGKLIVNNAAVVGFDLTDAARTKVTTVFDESAAAIADFSITKSASIFLMPSVVYIQAIAPVGGGRREIIGGFATLSRELFLPLLEAYDFGGSVLELPVLQFINGTLVFQTLDATLANNPDSSGIRTFITTYFANLINSKIDEYPGAAAFDNGTPTAISAFPGATPINGDYYFTSIGAFDGFYDFDRKVLAAVIKTDNQIYYVWRELSPEYAGTIQIRFQFL